MTDALNIQSTDKGRNVLLYEAPTSSATVLNMVDSAGNLLIFNDGGNWLNSTGDQMVDSAANDLVFGRTQWGSAFTVYYLLGPRRIAAADVSLNILRS